MISLNKLRFVVAQLRHAYKQLNDQTVVNQKEFARGLISPQIKELEKMIKELETQNHIFVFGSNLAGIHGAGSALEALKNHGAEYGVGIGRTGNAYAIPTKDRKIKTLPLMPISRYVADFIVYASENPDLKFDVVKIGCGLAGYKEEQIAPMFKEAPDNVNLPKGWRELSKRLL